MMTANTKAMAMLNPASMIIIERTCRATSNLRLLMTEVVVLSMNWNPPKSSSTPLPQTIPLGCSDGSIQLSMFAAVLLNHSHLLFGCEIIGGSSTSAEASTSHASDCHWHPSIPRSRYTIVVLRVIVVPPAEMSCKRRQERTKKE